MSFKFLLVVLSLVRCEKYIGYAKELSGNLPEHGIDQGWFTVNVSTNFPVEVFSLYDECWKVMLI